MTTTSGTTDQGKARQVNGKITEVASRVCETTVPSPKTQWRRAAPARPQRGWPLC